MNLPLTPFRLPKEIAKGLPPGTRAFKLGECGVFVSRDQIEVVYPPRWHLSISHESRYPTWEEIGQARDRLLPDDTFMCIPFPPREHWLSIHPNCFHLWEFRDDSLQAQMVMEGETAREMGKGEPEPSRVHRP